MGQFMGTLSALSPTVSEFLSEPLNVLWVLVLVLCAVLVGVLIVILCVMQMVKHLTGGTLRKQKDNGTGGVSVGAPVPNDEDAKIAAAIAASIVAMEDRAVVAAITAAVKVYLEAENGGEPLKSGFRVVSFKRRSTGSWNRK